MKNTILLSLVFLVITSSILLSEVRPIPTSQNQSQYFIENKGQWDPQVKYLARLGGLDYWITNTGAVYDYFQFEMNEIPEPRPDNLADAQDPIKNSPKIKKWWGHVIKNSLFGMNPEFKVVPDGKKEGIYNYFFGNDESKWVTNVPLYSSVKMKNIYNGIDIVYYYDNNNVRYDFNIAPYADPNQIQMKFEGQDNVKISPNGDLVFGTSVGEVAHSQLFAYQEINGVQKQIECKFVDKGNGIIAFNITGYDPSRPLTIDPTVLYVTYFGRNNTDYPYGTDIDPSGNVIQTGYTYSTNLPVTTGAYQSTIQSTPCTYVVKMNSAGNGLIFCTYLGGNSYSYPYAGCASDANGNTYVVGMTYATNWPTTSGALKTTYQSGSEGFVTKLNTTGSALVYSTYLAGNNTDYPYAMYVDPTGYCYVTGYTYSTNWPVSSGAFQTSMPYASYPNVFATKLNQSGSAVAVSSYLGSSSSYAYGYGVGGDINGNMYVTGYTYGLTFPTTAGAYKTTGTTTPEIFVTKFNSTGSALAYSTYIQGNNTDITYGLAVDPAGQAVITGYTYSTNYPVTPGALQSTISTTPDGFVTKLNATGTGLIFSTYLGGTSTDYGRGLVCDAEGNTYVGGYTMSTNHKGITADAFKATNTGGYDAYLVVFNSTGTNTYGTYIGGTGTDYAYYFKCVGINSLNQVAIGGYTTSTSGMPITPGAYQTTMSTSPDGWIAKFQFDPPLELATGNVIPTQFCKGDYLKVSYNIVKGFVKADNIFKVELSDEYGTFASPRVIGQLQTTVDGTIDCQMPTSALPVSSNYKVRVTASNPVSLALASAQNLTVNPAPFSYNVTGENGYCANAKEGSLIGIDDTEKYSYYQLYRDGVKVGVPIAGTDQPINFGKFKNTGIYTVEGVSPFGCKSWMAGQVEVIVIPLPIAYNMTGGGVYFDQPGPGTYCEGSDGVAIGLSKGDLGVNYQLKLNGKDVSVPIQGRGDKISFGYFTEEGVYDIEALSIKGGCFAKMVGSITVKRLPAPSAYDVQSTGGFCEGTAGSEIKLSNSDIGYSYQLFYNGKAQGSSKIGTGSQLSFGLFNKAGAYTVLSTNTSSGCTKMMKGTINLAPVPSPKAFDVSGNGKFCEGDDGAVISLSNSSTNAVYELYNNSIPTGNKLVGTGSELTFTPVNVDGNYSVVATTINGGCSLPMNGIVQVTKVPLPDATITGNKAPGMNTIEKYSIEKPQENETYLWKASNGEIIGSNTAAEITVNWADKKTGTVELYRKNGWGCSNWEILNVDLTNVLTAEFTSKQLKGDVPFLVEFTNNSTGLVSSYLWEFGDGGTSPQVNPSHTYKQVGKYSVKLTISHENDSKTITKADYVTVLPPNSVEEDGQSFNSNKTAGISLIEPNPAKNEIRFDYSLSFDQNIDLAVFDALGNKVLSITSGIVPQGSQNMSVDISKLTSGNYYLQLSTKDGNVTKHFSIVK